MDLDLSEFKSLSASLGRATAAMVAAEHGVVAKALLNVKKSTRKGISTHPSWGKLARTVNYDQVGLDGQVGYDDVGQGELAGIAEFGSARHSPHPALMPAARDEAPRFEKATANIAAAIFEAAVAGDVAKLEYVTKAGKSIMATQAQIANWTRGSS